MQWIVVIICIAGAIAILMIALPAMGINVPAFVIQIFWVVAICLFAIGAIGLIYKVWSSWGGPPGP